MSYSQSILFKCLSVSLTMPFHTFVCIFFIHCRLLPVRAFNAILDFIGVTSFVKESNRHWVHLGVIVISFVKESNRHWVLVGVIVTSFVKKSNRNWVHLGVIFISFVKESNWHWGHMGVIVIIWKLTLKMIWIVWSLCTGANDFKDWDVAEIARNASFQSTWWETHHIAMCSIVIWRVYGRIQLNIWLEFITAVDIIFVKDVTAIYILYICLSEHFRVEESACVQRSLKSYKWPFTWPGLLVSIFNQSQKTGLVFPWNLHICTHRVMPCNSPLIRSWTALG